MSAVSRTSYMEYISSSTKAPRAQHTNAPIDTGLPSAHYILVGPAFVLQHSDCRRKTLPLSLLAGRQRTTSNVLALWYESYCNKLHQGWVACIMDKAHLSSNFLGFLAVKKGIRLPKLIRSRSYFYCSKLCSYDLEELCYCVSY